MVSAEGSERTEEVLATRERLCERHENVGTTLQAYLRRTPGDLERALERPAASGWSKGHTRSPGASPSPGGSDWAPRTGA